MKHHILALVFVMASVSAAIATNPIREGNMISGHVFMRGSEGNVPYATVLIVGSEQGTVSNEEGQFELRNLSMSKYTSRVFAVGYKAQEKETEVNKDFTAVVHFQMQEKDFMTDEVVVSVNRNEMSRKVAPIVANVMSTKLSEMVNSTDFTETLNYQLELCVEDNCQNCGFPQMRIDGLEGPCPQVLTNNRPTISTLGEVYGLEQIPVNMTERMEVVRGGGSALFGTNAMGGTINIITRDPINSSFQVSSMFSNMDGKSWEWYMGTNVSLVAKDNSYGVAPYGNYRNRSPYNRGGDGFSELGRLNMNASSSHAYYRPVHLSRINLEYHTTNEFRRGGNRFGLRPYEIDVTEQIKHIISSSGLSYDPFWCGYKHRISSYGSTQHTDRNSYYGAQKDLDAYGKMNDLTWAASDMYAGNMNNCLSAPAAFTGGLEYQNNSIHDVMTGYYRDMQQDVRIANAFVQSEWRVNVLTMLVGARLDGHNLINRLIFSSRVSLLYKPFEDFQARLAYSTGFRASQVYNEDLHVTAMGDEDMQIKLADNLRGERSNSYSGSMGWTAHLGHWQANILVGDFYTDLHHVFVLEDIGKNDTDDVIKEHRNGNDARVYGANLDAKIAHDEGTRFQSGFTTQRNRYAHEEVWTKVDGVDLTTKRMSHTPDYYGYLTSSSIPVRNFDSSLFGTYTGKMIASHYTKYIEKDHMEDTPQFFDLNLKLNYTLVLHDHIKFQLSTGMQNIFNSFQKDLDEREFHDAGYFYGPTQPHTFFIGSRIVDQDSIHDSQTNYFANNPAFVGKA